MKLKLSVLAIVIGMSPLAYGGGCGELLNSPPATINETAKELDVWLPIDEFNISTANWNNPSSYSSHFLNPRTGEKKLLPTGWMLPDYLAVPDDEPWVVVQKPLAKHQAVYNFANVKTGALLLSDSSSLSSARKFVNGVSIVHKNGSQQFFLLNTKGQMTPVDSRVNWMIEGSRGLFPAMVDNSFPAYVNLEGQIVLPNPPNSSLPAGQKFLRVDAFKNELALFSVGENFGYDPSARFGYMGLDFSWKIPPRFTEANGFVDGRAWVKEENLWGIIDTNGDWIVEPKFSYHSYGESSEYFIASEPGKPMKVYNSLGQEAYELPKEANAYSFNSVFIHDGIALLPIPGGWQRYFDLKNQVWIGNFNYEITNSFSYGYARITVRGESQNHISSLAEGYLTLDGKIVGLMPRFGDVKQLGLPPNALLESKK